MAFRAFPPEVAGYTTKFCALRPTHLLLLAIRTGVKSYLLNHSPVLWSKAKVCTVFAIWCDCGVIDEGESDLISVLLGALHQLAGHVALVNFGLGLHLLRSMDWPL